MAESFHRAFFYDRPSDFVTTTVSFLREGLARGERGLVLADRRKIEWIRTELGDAASAVEFVEARAAYQPQGAATRLVLDFLARGVDGQPGARVVAERSTGDLTRPEARDYLRQEAAANIIYLPYPVSILCPYDRAGTDPAVLAGCRQVHPELVGSGGPVPSLDYSDPATFIREHAATLPVPADAAHVTVDTVDDLSLARQFVRSQARMAGLAPSRVDDITLAVNELVSNAVVHGVPPRRISVFLHDRLLVYDINDAGGGPDPLGAYLPPRVDQPGGRGLWIAHLTCDAIEFGRGPDGVHLQAAVALFG